MSNREETDKPVVRLKPSDYQPSKAVLEEPVTFPDGTSVEDLARAVLRPVRIVHQGE